MEQLHQSEVGRELSEPHKPFLLSIGVSFPLFGIGGHRYIRVKKKYKLRSKKVLGIKITWTTYKRVGENA